MISGSHMHGIQRFEQNTLKAQGNSISHWRHPGSAGVPPACFKSNRRPDGGAPRNVKSCATPRPVGLESLQTGLHWILFDIRDHFLVMFRVAHISVEILALPKRAVPLQEHVRLMTGKGFPRM